jgi:hypothetical protein
MAVTTSIPSQAYAYIGLGITLYERHRMDEKVIYPACVTAKKPYGTKIKRITHDSPQSESNANTKFHTKLREMDRRP